MEFIYKCVWLSRLLERIGLPSPKETIKLGIISTLWAGFFLGLFIGFRHHVGLPYPAALALAEFVFICTKFPVVAMVFEKRDRDAAPRQMGQYALLEFCIFLANLGLIAVLIEFFHVDYRLAQGLLILPLGLVSFIGTKYIFASNILAKVPSS